jgi:photosystem II stability/assembly factor-like uncharacterized protein
MKTSYVLVVLLFLAGPRAEAQWSGVDSGTTSSLRGVYLLDSGVGYSVGDSGTILKSTDTGMTWNALTSGTTKPLYDVYFFNDAEGVAVGDGGLILRTTDGGANWATVASGVRDGLRSVSFSGANGISGGLSQDILYSSDSGASWHVSQKGFFGGGFFGAQMLSPTLGVITGQNSIFQGLQGTTVDGGVHWTFHPFYFNGNEGSADDIFFFDDMTGVSSGVLFDGTGAIARTSNGGADWNSTIFPQGLQGIDFPKPESGFAVGFGGAILKSSDLGLTWSAQTSGTFFDLFDVHFASDGLTGIAVGAAGTILQTTNGGQEGELDLIAAVSRKGHFDIDLPLTGPSGVEDRSGGPNKKYTVVMTFDQNITSVGSASSTCGSVQSIVIDSADAHNVNLNLVNVAHGCNGSTITVTADSITDDQGNVLDSASVGLGLLLGDVNGDRVVSRVDSNQAQMHKGQKTVQQNFRNDVNADGHITSSDIQLIRQQQGTSLP